MEQYGCNVDVIWNIVEDCGCFVDVMWNIVDECGCFVEQCGCTVEQCGCDVDVMWNIVEEYGCIVEQCGCYVEHCGGMWMFCGAIGCNEDPPHLQISQFDQVLSSPWSVILKYVIVDVFVDVMWNIVEECGCFMEKCGCNVDPPHLHISQFDQQNLVLDFFLRKNLPAAPPPHYKIKWPYPYENRIQHDRYASDYVWW